MTEENKNEIDLTDLSFDFEDYFRRHGTDEMGPEESEEFAARVYGLFCRAVFESGGDTSKIPFWAANYIAEKLNWALGGVPWHDIMAMPWDKPTPLFNPKEKRAFDIYAGVTNALRDAPNDSVTDLIYEQAKNFSVSYETARADYYATKKWIDQGDGIPVKFINNASNI